jgi:hypothetical protein
MDLFVDAGLQLTEVFDKNKPEYTVVVRWNLSLPLSIPVPTITILFFFHNDWTLSSLIVFSQNFRISISHSIFLFLFFYLLVFEMSLQANEKEAMVAFWFNPAPGAFVTIGGSAVKPGEFSKPVVSANSSVWIFVQFCKSLILFYFILFWLCSCSARWNLRGLWLQLNLKASIILPSTKSILFAVVSCFKKQFFISATFTTSRTSIVSENDPLNT